MKVYIINALLILCAICSAQSGDYIVKRDGDTIKPKNGSLEISYDQVRVLTNFEIQTFSGDEVNTVYFMGLFYDPVIDDSQVQARLMIREFSGDVNVYRYQIQNPGEGANGDVFYFRQKDQPPREVQILKLKNLKKVSTYSCKSIMDSLLAKADWTTVLRDMVKEYNESCEALKTPK